MHRAWKIAAGVPATVFIVAGLSWFVAPGFVAARLRMALLEGDGLATQIGDLGSFFLVMGTAITIALVTDRAIWFYPAIMLLAVAATGRVIAWLAHGANLTLDMIVVEVVVAGLLFVVSRKMTAAAA